MQKQSFQWPDLFHFVHFVILILFFVLGYSYAESLMLFFPFLMVKFKLVLQLASLFLYHWFALRSLKNKGQSGHYLSAQQFQWQWLKRFTYASFFVCITIAFLNYFMVILYPQLNYVRPGFLVLTLFIYWIIYEGLYRPEIFNVIKGNAEQSLSGAENVPKLTVHRPVKRYLKSNLTENEADRIIRA